MLRDMDEQGHLRRMTKLDHQADFDAIWNNRFSDEERRAMLDALNTKLDELVVATPCNRLRRVP